MRMNMTPLATTTMKFSTTILPAVTVVAAVVAAQLRLADDDIRSATNAVFSSTDEQSSSMSAVALSLQANDAASGAETTTMSSIQPIVVVDDHFFSTVITRMLVIMALALFGNAFLVFVICRGNLVARQRISPVQLLLLHTCAADLLFATALGTEAAIIRSFPRFNASDLVCRLIKCGQALPLYASPFLLVAISFDRYEAICHPMHHFRSDRYRRPNRLALAAWLLALVCAVPQLLIWGKQETENRHGGPPNELCLWNDEYVKHWNHIYVILFDLVAWILPTCFSAYFYYNVCRAVWLSRGPLEKMKNNNNGTELEQMQSNNHHHQHRLDSRDGEDPRSREDSTISLNTRVYVASLRNHSRGLRSQLSEFDRKRIQTVRLTLTIIACNFFLWAPFCVINLIQVFHPKFTNNHPNLVTFMQILGNLNACVNPWIYILYNCRHTRLALSPLFSIKKSSSITTTSITNGSGDGRLCCRAPTGGCGCAFGRRANVSSSSAFRGADGREGEGQHLASNNRDQTLVLRLSNSNHNHSPLPLTTSPSIIKH